MAEVSHNVVPSSLRVFDSTFDANFDRFCCNGVEVIYT